MIYMSEISYMTYMTHITNGYDEYITDVYSVEMRELSLLRAESVGEWNADTAYSEKGKSRSLLLVVGQHFRDVVRSITRR